MYLLPLAVSNRGDQVNEQDLLGVIVVDLFVYLNDCYYHQAPAIFNPKGFRGGFSSGGDPWSGHQRSSLFPR